MKRKAGVIVTDGKYMLAGLPTGRKDIGNAWDIPKGFCHPGEDDLDAAIRELQEETGLDASISTYNFKGLYRYKEGSLAIYKILMKLPPLKFMICTSQCVRKFKLYPEIGKFAYVPIVDLPYYFFQSLVPILLDCMREEYFSQSLDKIG